MIDLGQNITCSLKVLKYYKLDVVPVLFHGHNIYGAPRSNAIYTILDGDGRANRIAHLVQFGIVKL